MRKILILILLFYFLVIFQESFLSHFTVLGATPNLILISVFLLIFLEKNSVYQNPKILPGFLGGTILDLFSSIPFGIFTLNLTLSSFLTQKISRIFKESNILAFSILFLFYFSFYKVLLIFENFVSLILFKRSFGISFNFGSFFSEFFLSFLLILLVLFLTKKYAIFLQR